MLQRVSALPRLADAALLRTQAYIDGQWCDGAHGRFAVTNPADGGQLAEVATCGAAQAQAAIAAAARALPAWRGRTAKERAAVLRRWFELMLAAQEDLAQIMTAEQGKPLAEARGEVAYGASFIEWFAEEGKRVYGETIPTHSADKRIVVQREPVGVCAAITPWNFPNAMLPRKVGPARAAGCTIGVTPAAQPPLSALALAELAQRAGLPAGVLNVLPADGAQSIAIGGVLCDSPVVRKLSFTGSTEVGRILARQCAPTLKKLSLELGGNAPFIVFDDADLDAAVEGAVASKYRNTGQTCVCANRFYVQSGVYDAFAEKLVKAVSTLRVGAGLSGPTEQGPLIDARALAKVESHVADALARGGRIAAGGKRHALGGNFYEPTVLLDVAPGMKVAREETFGPVAPLFRFDTEEEAVRMANDTESGLAAYFYTRDLARSWRVQEALEYGIVGVNTGIFSTEVAPFGGVKESGLGREGSRHGIEEYTEIKYVCVGGLTP
ncbi:MAG: NAD-dependent succinate-semialdehyde dehydrogenase [Betaproteobacteria bacterium]